MMEVKCSYCEKKLFRFICSIKKNKSGLFFCNQKCKGKYTRKRIKVKCDNCNKVFEKTKRNLTNKNFCSNKCQGEYITKTQTREITCFVCKKKVRKTLSEYKKYRFHFCSKECYKKGRKILLKNGIYKNNLFKTKRFFNTKPEEKMGLILNKLGLKFKRQFYLKGKVYDFYLPDYNTLIEVDGEYWHNYPNGTINDLIKNFLAFENNYKLLRFWTKDILKNRDYVEYILNKEVKNARC